MFRRSDVIATGDVLDETSYPVIDTARGGSIDGELVALNHIIEIAVPADKEQGGTMVIPGHGRLCDQADVVYYKNVMTTIRNRIQYYKNQGKTLQQVLAIKPTWDWDERWGHDSGPWTTSQFVEAIYKTLPARGPSFSMQNETVVPAGANAATGKIY
jgi:cyclase